MCSVLKQWDIVNLLLLCHSTAVGGGDWAGEQSRGCGCTLILYIGREGKERDVALASPAPLVPADVWAAMMLGAQTCHAKGGFLQTAA